MEMHVRKEGGVSPRAKYPLLPEAYLDYDTSFLGSTPSSNSHTTQ